MLKATPAFEVAYECCNFVPGTADQSCCTWLDLKQDPASDEGWSGDHKARRGVRLSSAGV